MKCPRNIVKIAGLRSDIAKARRDTNTNPSEAQIKAENYKKGSFPWKGLTIKIENPKGSTRSGTSDDGKQWSIVMKYDYGYIGATKSKADGDAVDVFIGSHPESEIVFIIDQTFRGKFDEHKCVIGALTEDEARKTYLANYEKGWTCGKINSMTVDQFKEWVKKGNTGKPVSDQKLFKVSDDSTFYKHSSVLKRVGELITGSNLKKLKVSSLPRGAERAKVIITRTGAGVLAVQTRQVLPGWGKDKKLKKVEGVDNLYATKDIGLVKNIPTFDSVKVKTVIRNSIRDLAKKIKHPQVIVTKRDLDNKNLKELGFKVDRMNIPLPGRKLFGKSYRSGKLHAHDIGPAYLVHEDEVDPYRKGVLSVVKHNLKEGGPAAYNRWIKKEKSPVLFKKAAIPQSLLREKAKDYNPMDRLEMGRKAGVYRTKGEYIKALYA